MIFVQHGCFYLIILLIACIPTQIVFAQPVNVKGVEINLQKLYERIPLSGTVYSSKVTNLSAQVGGWITETVVDTGDYVEQGDVLIKLDKVQATLALKRAKAHLEEAKIFMKLKEQEWKDVNFLLKSKNVAVSTVRERRVNFEAAIAQWHIAKISVEQAQVYLERHEITAPFSGTISHRHHYVGEWIEPGMALVEIVHNKDMKVDFQVPQRFYSQIKEDTFLMLSLDAYPDQGLSAQVSAKIPKATVGARTFLLRTELTDSKVELFPGMGLSGQLFLPAPPVLAVPRDALIRYPDGRVTIWAAEFLDWEKPVRVHEHKVSLGINSGDWVEVKNGIEKNAVVITISNEGLREGQEVFLKPDDRVRVAR